MIERLLHVVHSRLVYIVHWFWKVCGKSNLGTFESQTKFCIRRIQLFLSRHFNNSLEIWVQRDRNWANIANLLFRDNYVKFSECRQWDLCLIKPGADIHCLLFWPTCMWLLFWPIYVVVLSKLLISCWCQQLMQSVHWR